MAQVNDAIRGHANAPDAAKRSAACEGEKRAFEHMGTFGWCRRFWKQVREGHL